MDKFKMSQILNLLVIAAFSIITPLLSTSLRPKYLYFIVNLLIIALGAEAGLLSFIFHTAEDKKTAAVVTDTINELADSDHGINEIIDSDYANPKSTVIEKCSSEKFAVSVNVGRVKKCPSSPSIFFIGGGDETEPEDFVEDDDDDHGQEDVGELSGQEMFQKAEAFIGNFYEQLKMEREDSWKKLHDGYQKAF